MATTCRYDYCDRFAKQSGLCLTHFRWMHPATSPSHCSSASASPSNRTTADPKLKLKNRNRKCRTEHCLSYARSGGFCTRHGGGRKCKYENCTTASQTGGFCRLHGGGSRCRVEACAQFARIGGLCLQHNRGRTETKSLYPPAHDLYESPVRS
ncbi:hypothetical protein ACHHYP_14430 [Achlya hypogyna]|uniref:WRKY19-like zinc finger domain-containing protein n=1 Tax=Achlya hypogyna TaxID=1202772 RepID=A0A1V9YD82_ACHHY|nr:hypothetical protein ACHHYP_14430 [Achlya hypogyna]